MRLWGHLWYRLVYELWYTLTFVQYITTSYPSHHVLQIKSFLAIVIYMWPCRSLFKAGHSSLVRLEQQIPNTYSPAVTTAVRKKPKTIFVVVFILHYEMYSYAFSWPVATIVGHSLYNFNHGQWISLHPDDVINCKIMLHLATMWVNILSWCYS